MYVLDSSALIEVLEQGIFTKKIEEVCKDQPLVTTSICMHEVLVGASSDKDRFVLEHIFTGIRVLEHNTDAARIGATIVQDLKRKGKMIGRADVFIAAICKANNAVIVTLDKDFEKIKEVKSKIIS